ncbi:response regulator transcription factor [Streptosporangiaceae bacterium NEAU-GS5]|nr:response regulator transcription factor [Streptosporangiaceae bacterium NEAU-GS5]
MRVVIAEDSVLLREGLIRLLADGAIETVAAVGDALSLIEAVAEHQPDLAIVDVRMPPTNTDDGLRAAVELRALHPKLAVLVLSQYVEERYASELIGPGVGYLLKERVADVEEFFDAVHRVAGGGTVIDPDVVMQLLSRAHDPLDRLTPRESEVLSLMAEGRSNTAIAARLGVTEGAVEKHISGIFVKLGLDAAPDDHRRVLAVLTYLRIGR